MNRAVRKLLAEAEQHGYAHTATNCKGVLVYTGPGGHELRISPGAPEHQVRAATKDLRRAAGTYTPPTGRHAQAVKDRAARRRELDSERLAAERRELQAQRDAFLAARAAAPHLNHDRDALGQVENRLAELDRLDALMRTAPSTEHRARHTSGERAS